MFEASLVPEKTVINGKGESAGIELSGIGTRILLLVLHITDIVEQESLDVSIWGSADGSAWGDKPLATFPQKFYRSEHPLLLDLSARPEVKFLRARWEANRWGRGSETPMFQFSLSAREVPAEMLSQA
ncbi:MAG TPA: hypothetical protein VE998_02715 [Terriglobales bacterium]|nr:hypothetical protein [Terriglobales bacterium]